MTSPTSERELEIIVLPAIFRPIGPADDVVVSSEKMREYLMNTVKDAQRSLLDKVEAEVEANYQKQNTIGRAGDDGFTKIYVDANYRQDILAALAQLRKEIG